MAACLPAKAAGEAEAAPIAASILANKALSVSTSDTPAEAALQRLVSAEKTKENLDLKNCVAKPLTRIIAKTLLHTMTRSVVNWINSGFRGSPSFVTDPEGFLTDVADQSIGRVIEDIAPVLCQPFRFQLQLALGFRYSARSRDEVRCRLTDVISNVEGFYNSFVGGDFRAGGWQSWINIAGTPQNNAYGAFLEAQGQIQVGLVDAQGHAIRGLNWGKGFQSWRTCKEYETITDYDTNAQLEAGGQAPAPSRKGKCKEWGPIKTPGSLIVDQASGSLGSALRELEVAQELDEIFAALVNQLLVRAFGGGSSGGFAGLSQPDSAGIVYINTIPTEIGDALGDRPKPHADIDCSRSYSAGGVDLDSQNAAEAGPLLATLSDADKTSIYPYGITASQNRVNDILLVEAKDENGFPIGFNTIAREKSTFDTRKTPPVEILGKPILKPSRPFEPIEQTWKEYMTDIAIACSREGSEGIIARGLERGGASGVEKIITRGGEGGITTPPAGGGAPLQVQKEDGNISRFKKAWLSQTHPYGGGRHNEDILHTPEAGNAVDGNTTGEAYFGLAAAVPSADAWWMVDLWTDKDAEQPAWSVEEIRSIKIYAESGNRYGWFALYRLAPLTSGVLAYTAVIQDDANTQTPRYSFNMLKANFQQGANSVITLNRIERNNPDSGSHLIATITFNPPIKKEQNPRYVWIGLNPVFTQETLSIAEVEVIGTATKITQAPGGAAPAKPFQIIAVPAESPGGRITLPSLLTGPLDPRAGDSLLFASGTTTSFVAVGKHQNGQNGKIKKLLLRLCKKDEYQVDAANPCGREYRQAATERYFYELSALLKKVHGETTTVMATPAATLLNDMIHDPIILGTSEIETPPDTRVSITFTGRLGSGSFAPPNDYKFVVQALYEVPKTVGVGADERTTTSVINFSVRN